MRAFLFRGQSSLAGGRPWGESPPCPPTRPSFSRRGCEASREGFCRGEGQRGPPARTPRRGGSVKGRPVGRRTWTEVQANGALWAWTDEAVRCPNAVCPVGPRTARSAPGVPFGTDGLIEKGSTGRGYFGIEAPCVNHFSSGLLARPCFGLSSGSRSASPPPAPTTPTAAAGPEPTRGIERTAATTQRASWTGARPTRG